jgi:small subunit ribosomal protein S11
MAKAAATAAARPRRKERKNITSGVAHVNASFNNTMITITDAQGNTIAWSSSGSRASRARASRPRTPRRWPPKMRRPQGDGARHAHARSRVSGPGSGRESALRALQAVGFTVTSIRDVTPIPHNGCRPPSAAASDFPTFGRRRRFVARAAAAECVAGSDTPGSHET